VAEPEIASLVADAAAGDAEALAQIMAAHDSDIARVCMVICGEPSLAREAQQTAWISAWRRLGTLRDPMRLRPWLVAVAANEARQLLRRERRRQDREGRAAAPWMSPDPDASGEWHDLGEALGRLDGDDRRLLALSIVAGLTSEEVARELGGSASAIRGRLARLLARLRRELGDD
jgi:RNA polymerase sigma-70 factor (ECF subfamily)